jgi:carbohydrate-binding DOMON domain-containing protein
MSASFRKAGFAALAAGILAATAVSAQEASFKDPTGDDKGPGNYTYPTDSVYKKGSFDLTGLDVKQKGGKVEVAASLATALEDPWRMGTGFSVQMIFVFVDNKPGGHKEGLPGLNVTFADGNEWDKVIVLSPQAPGRVKSEAEQKAGALGADVVVPTRVKGTGRTITGTVDLAQLGGEGDVSKWGYQVVMQSNEGFPDGKDLLTRKVNEYEGQHRFGGGTDSDCDPNAIDILGDDQAAQLKYECNGDGTAKTSATLKMVRK